MADRVDPDPRIFSDSEFRHLLAREVQRSTRYQDFLTLCLVRPDYPGEPDPQIHGEIARALAELLRATDVLGLMDETIGILLLHTPHAEALAVMERVRNHIVESFARSGALGPGVGIALHLGLVSFPEHATDDSALLAKAQESLAASGSGDAAPPSA